MCSTKQARLTSLSDEIHTNEVPLCDICFSDFIELVVRQDVRPLRPDSDEAPYLTDGVWQLAERCWTKDPLARPSISMVCDAICDSPGNKLHVPPGKVCHSVFFEYIYLYSYHRSLYPHRLNLHWFGFHHLGIHCLGSPLHPSFYHLGSLYSAHLHHLSGL